MDLLSLVGQVTKRKGDLFSQAETLARKTKTQEKLEKLMFSESKALVKALRDKAIRWEEYHRSLVETTLVSALAAVYIGSYANKPRSIMEKAWPTIIGDMLPPLLSFLNETEKYLENGSLLLGDLSQDFSEWVFEEGEIWEEDETIFPVGVNPAGLGEPPLKKKPSWKGIFSRVTRYIASPTYSFEALGNYLVKAGQGHALMRRVTKGDLRTCPDCNKLESLGWQPLGSLPMPGRECRCYDRCRCRIEYR